MADNVHTDKKHDMALKIVDKPVPTKVSLKTICLYCTDFQLQNSNLR